MRKKKNNKIAKIIASAILLITTNSLTSYAVNKSEYLVADAATSPILTNQVADDNIKPEPLNDRTTPKPLLIEKPPASPPPPPKIRPEAGDCGYWVWNVKLRKWVYFSKCEQPPEIPHCGYWVWHPKLRKWVYVNTLCYKKPRLLKQTQSTNELEKELVNVQK